MLGKKIAIVAIILMVSLGSSQLNYATAGNDFIFMVDGYYIPEMHDAKKYPWLSSRETMGIRDGDIVYPGRYSAELSYSAEAISFSKYLSQGEFSVYSTYGGILYFYNNQLYGIDGCLPKGRQYYLKDPNGQKTFDGKLFKQIIKRFGQPKVSDQNENNWFWNIDDLYLGIIKGKDRFGEYNMDVLFARHKKIYDKIYALIDERREKAIAKGKAFEKKARANERQESIKVKGLYLGMYCKDAMKIIEDIFGEQVQMSKSSDSEYEAYNYGATIRWGKDGYLTSIYIKDTDTFFDMQDVTTKEFVKDFCKAYKIPKMKYYEKKSPDPKGFLGIGNSTGYEYESPQGYRIHILDSAVYKARKFENNNHLTIAKTKKKKGTFN